MARATNGDRQRHWRAVIERQRASGQLTEWRRFSPLGSRTLACLDPVLPSGLGPSS
jgi:hypothetical protein